MIVREYTYGNAVITVYRPELTEYKLKEVEKQIVISLQQIGKELKENE
jgi:hypothetical protein